MSYPTVPVHGFNSNANQSNHASSSKSRLDLDNLPPLPTLISWSHRPQAIAKCFISDVYRMQAVMQQGMEGMSYASRDIFLLNQFPCKMVEIVAWVAGVDHKEMTMTITVDDGDGQHVLPILIRLPIVQPISIPNPSKSRPKIPSTQNTFTTASERRIAKRKATEESEESKTQSQSKWSNLKQYERKDIRVGDTVKVIGKIDEWMRKKSDGSVEWVRQVVVDENAGGSIVVVEPETQYYHAAEVSHLHQTLYSQPFVLPDLNIPTRSLPTTPSKNVISSIVIDPSFSDSFGTTLTSEAPSELSMIDAEPELRDPAKLRSSQLTDRTFRQYMLDHMTQETIRSITQASELGHSTLRFELETYFPEYRQSPHSNNNENRYASRRLQSASSSSGIFTPSSKINSLPTQTQNDNLSTPTQKSFISRKSTQSSSSFRSTVPSSNIFKAFTPTTILSNERLNTLAGLVVDNESRKEERRRRRRIRDGTATKKDLQIESERKLHLLNGGLKENPCMPDLKERIKKMERLVSWAIRAISEEGSLVQVTIPPHISNEKYGYLPLPSALLLPLCIPHLISEREFRKSTFRKKNDPKSINGMTVDELTNKLKKWGQDGRWERIGDWNLEDALEYGHNKGWLVKCGFGYWVADDYQEGLV